MMTKPWTLATCAAGIALAGVTLDAQDLSRYRTFDLGSDLATVLTLTGVAPAEAKRIHERPALLQDLEWRPSRWLRSNTMSTDPVDRILFSFYNNQLFRLVVDYAKNRTQGMTDGDMTEAISAVYGPPLERSAGVRRVAPAGDTAVARWEDAQHSMTLYRTSSYGGDSLRLIVTKRALEALARTAEIEALRLDELEAPSREIARQKREQADGLAADERARTANKGVFRP